MATSKAPERDRDVPEDAVDDEAYITQDDVLAEVTEDGDDHPMDEDDEEAAQQGDGEGIEVDENVEDTSIQHFEEHGQPVFAIQAHPTQPLAVSGGEDETGYIWNVAEGEIVVKLTGHTDSIGSVGWSFDGTMVATGGMDGKVRVWRRVGTSDWNTWEFLTELQGPDEIMWIKWHPKGNVLLAGSNDSTVWLWQLPSGNTMQVFAGHEGPVNAGAFTTDGKRIITGDASGTLIMWDPRSPTPVWKMTPNTARFGMEEGITAIASNLASTAALVGGSNGEVRIVNLAKGEVIGALEGHKEGESVEAIVFVDWGSNVSSAGVAVSGATDGQVIIWDLSTMKQRATLTHDDAITSLNVHPASTGKGHYVTSASADRKLKTWDTRSGQLLRTHTAHHAGVMGASVGAFEEYIYVLSAGDDGMCFVFDAAI